MTAKFEVLRAFCLAGEIVNVHEIVELSDSSLISNLLDCGRIVPADDSARARVRRANPWFEPPKEYMFGRVVQRQGMLQ